ncbi:uncharacterized protein LOC144297055 isoform X2 [Canis aureus]
MEVSAFPYLSINSKTIKNCSLTLATLSSSCNLPIPAWDLEAAKTDCRQLNRRPSQDHWTSGSKQEIAPFPLTSLSWKTTRVFFVPRLANVLSLGVQTPMPFLQSIVYTCIGFVKMKKMHDTHHQESEVVPGNAIEKSFGMNSPWAVVSAFCYRRRQK